MPLSVASWWGLLCAVSVLNILLWALAAVALRRRKNMLPQEAYALRRLQLLLSAVYVFGCAFRAGFPVFDIPRFCMLDSWLSSVLIGRSIATLAELCFVVQWSLMLRQIADATGSVLATVVARTVVPLIVVAEVCSWYSVLTLSNLGHTAEESLWGVSAALLVVGMLVVSVDCTGALRRMLRVACAVGIAYVLYMFIVDVPRYWERWLFDEASGRHYLTISQGLIDVSTRRIVSYRWVDWKDEVVWKSLYFSVAVWFSIFLVLAPAATQSPLIDQRRRLSSATA